MPSGLNAAVAMGHADDLLRRNGAAHGRFGPSAMSLARADGVRRFVTGAT
jgi:hypothetical protein